MNGQYRMAMKQAISNVLETMFFFLPSFIDDGTELPGNVGVCEIATTISVTNDSEHIKILFWATEHFARMTTANFLGMGESEVQKEDMVDTVKELANMIGGDHLARLAPGSWQLGIPCLESPENGDRVFPPPSSNSLQLWADDEPMLFVTWNCGV
jgi:hypothetical protein